MSIMFSSGPSQLAFVAKSVGVFRYNGGTYTLLPAVRVLQVEDTEGPDPGSARFRYEFDPSGNTPGAPSRWDDVFPLQSYPQSGVDVVKNDDRIAVLEFDPAGNATLVHHGFAQIPQLDIDPEGQHVTFTSLGAGIRTWDKPLAGAVVRDMVDPTVVMDLQTDGVPFRFNPEGKPNCTPDGAMAGQAPWQYPTFVDPLVVRTPDIRTYWTVSKAARAILEVGNPQVDPITGANLNPWIVNPDFATLDSLLDSRAPLPGQSTFDPNNPATYVSSPLLCQDLDCSGKPCMEALNLLLEPHGFGMAFRTEQTGTGAPGAQIGAPYQYLEVYRKNDAGDPTSKAIPFQAPGQNLDLSQTVWNAASLSRSASELANQFALLTAPKRSEISVVLAPGFMISPDDADQVLTNALTTGSNGFDAVANKYRLFIFDETGEGHWHMQLAGWTQQVPSLDDVFGAPQNGVPQYTRRRRPGHGDLLTIPAGGTEPYRAQLWVQPYTDYIGPVPGLYQPQNSSAPWQEVKSGWRLCKDRLGIYITDDNPERDFNIGRSTDTNAPYPDGKINIVTALAQPDTNEGAVAARQQFIFRLTVVVDWDFGLGTLSPRRPSSPTQYAVQRTNETRDRFRLDQVDASSQFNTKGQDYSIRDDTKNAQDWSDARRLAHELGPTAGSFGIPYLTSAYLVGDRLSKVTGRQPDVTLAGNINASGEAPVYPSIVKVTREYDGKQGMSYQISDRRGEPARRRQG